MKVNVILADTGRPTGSGTLNLLNAGWTFTSGPPQPAQAVAVFIEAPWDQLNRQLDLALELVDDNGQVVDVQTPDGVAPAQLTQPTIISNVPGAPNGTPGSTVVFMELGPGVLQLSAGRRYTWRLSIDGQHEESWEASFWVLQSILQPKLGLPGVG